MRLLMTTTAVSAYGSWVDCGWSGTDDFDVAWRLA